MDDRDYLRMAIGLAQQGMEAGAGGPFGAVVAKDGRVLGRGCNCVTSTCDPTAHAEVLAIREACAALGSHRLDGAVIYASCEPCPMCLAAIYWARIDRIVYACDRADAAAIGFDDEFLYRELALPLTERRISIHQDLAAEGRPVMRAWLEKADRVPY